MQLSASTTFLQPSSNSARSECAGVAPVSAEDQAILDSSDLGQTAEFGDLLPGEGDKPKSNAATPSSPRAGKNEKPFRSLKGEPLEGVTTSPVANGDVMAMIASAAIAALGPDATPLTLPEFDGSFSPAAGEDSIPAGESGFAPATAAASILSTGVPASSARQVISAPKWDTPAIPEQTAALNGVPLTAPTQPAPAGIQANVPLGQEKPDTEIVVNLVGEPLELSSTLESPRGFPTSQLDRGIKPQLVNRAGANLAAPAITDGKTDKVEIMPGPKNFLFTEEEMNANRSEFLGTDVAKRSLTMASAHSTLPPSAVAEMPAFGAVVTSPVQTDVTSPAQFLAETNSVAHSAVEAALSAADRVSAERNSVTLQFSVGGNDLAVRVDFRGGAVQTTFRTDSPELRAALAHEWSAAGSQMTDASVRMAPPVFTSSDAGTSTSFSGESAYHHQQQQQRESSARPSAERFSLNAFRPVSDPSAASRAPSSAVRQAVSTAKHLHTFA